MLHLWLIITVKCNWSWRILFNLKVVNNWTNCKIRCRNFYLLWSNLHDTHFLCYLRHRWFHHFNFRNLSSSNWWTSHFGDKWLDSFVILQILFLDDRNGFVFQSIYWRLSILILNLSYLRRFNISYSRFFLCFIISILRSGSNRELQIIWRHVLKNTIIRRPTCFKEVLLFINEWWFIIVHPFLLVNFPSLFFHDINFLFYKMVTFSFLAIDYLLSFWW
jgi:hypothetical protein